MALVISRELLKKTKSANLEVMRENSHFLRADTKYEIDTSILTVDDLKELLEIYQEAKISRSVKAIEAILKIREGNLDIPVPNFDAFQEMLSVYLTNNHIKGWLFKTEQDDKIYPYLIENVFKNSFFSGGKEDVSIQINLKSYSALYESNNLAGDYMGLKADRINFYPKDVVRKRIPDILANFGYFIETPELHADFQKEAALHLENVTPGFAKQFRVSGKTYKVSGYINRPIELHRRKVINDLSNDDYHAFNPVAECAYSMSEYQSNPRLGEIPSHNLVKVFDLVTHDYFWVNGAYMTPYEYDKSLSDKLILPANHRDLLSVLTTNLDDFTSDFIEGKSAGNVILCKGKPGVGKTLTAEIYSELIEKPLYSIHSGTLGTKASEIERSLQKIYARSARWDCVVLLDEADVFVSSRGDNLDRNAIVAEFLRTMEYFDGLMFMTTNRPDDIDDAIISRCIAIINYEPPTGNLARRSWKALSEQFGVVLDEKLVDQLVDLFPTIVQRDMKMLLKLVLKMEKSGEGKLDLDSFRRFAMFRAIDFKKE